MLVTSVGRLHAAASAYNHMSEFIAVHVSMYVYGSGRFWAAC